MNERIVNVGYGVGLVIAMLALEAMLCSPFRFTYELMFRLRRLHLIAVAALFASIRYNAVAYARGFLRYFRSVVVYALTRGKRYG